MAAQIKIYDREGENCLDLSNLQNIPKELNKAPFWQVHSATYGAGKTTYQVSGRSHQAYRKDVHCGFGLYLCDLTVDKEGSVTVSNWREEIVD